jgi:hypothetical protein
MHTTPPGAGFLESNFMASKSLKSDQRNPEHGYGLAKTGAGECRILLHQRRRG